VIDWAASTRCLIQRYVDDRDELWSPGLWSQGSTVSKPRRPRWGVIGGVPETDRAGTLDQSTESQGSEVLLLFDGICRTRP
jgi:hypothetical protein